jgi:hypothetical protein
MQEAVLPVVALHSRFAGVAQFTFWLQLPLNEPLTPNSFLT